MGPFQLEASLFAKLVDATTSLVTIGGQFTELWCKNVVDEEVKSHKVDKRKNH